MPKNVPPNGLPITEWCQEVLGVQLSTEDASAANQNHCGDANDILITLVKNQDIVRYPDIPSSSWLLQQPWADDATVRTRLEQWVHTQLVPTQSRRLELDNITELQGRAAAARINMGPVGRRMVGELKALATLEPFEAEHFCLLQGTGPIPIYYGALFGQPGTPYAGGVFYVSCLIPNEYPFRPPTVRFLTPIYHPRIGNWGPEMGVVCLPDLREEWGPVTKLQTIFTKLSRLLAEPSFLSEDAAGTRADLLEQSVSDPAAFHRSAAEHTQLHACCCCLECFIHTGARCSRLCEQGRAAPADRAADMVHQLFTRNISKHLLVHILSLAYGASDIPWHLTTALTMQPSMTVKIQTVKGYSRFRPAEHEYPLHVLCADTIRSLHRRVCGLIEIKSVTKASLWFEQQRISRSGVCCCDLHGDRLVSELGICAGSTLQLVNDWNHLECEGWIKATIEGPAGACQSLWVQLPNCRNQIPMTRGIAVCTVQARELRQAVELIVASKGLGTCDEIVVEMGSWLDQYTEGAAGEESDRLASAAITAAVTDQLTSEVSLPPIVGRLVDGSELQALSWCSRCCYSKQNDAEVSIQQTLNGISSAVKFDSVDEAFSTYEACVRSMGKDAPAGGGCGHGCGASCSKPTSIDSRKECRLQSIRVIVH